MSVQLTPRIEAMIHERVESGAYSNPSELIEQALAALTRQERLDDLRGKLQIGLDELERGEAIPFTKEWSAERRRLAIERAAAGQRPHPDVCPPS